MNYDLWMLINAIGFVLHSVMILIGFIFVYKIMKDIKKSLTKRGKK